MDQDFVDMCDGNFGAAGVINKLISIKGEFLAISILKASELTGCDIWETYKDQCGEDINSFYEHIKKIAQDKFDQRTNSVND